MAFYDPQIWVPYLPYIFIGLLGSKIYTSRYYEGENYLFSPVAIAYLLYLYSNWWSARTSEIVPEPYLDEVFHIPQAQAYCVGDFHVWDPKLTTPPGLYAFATAFGNLGKIRNCDVNTLRWFNSFALTVVFYYAGLCSVKIAKTSGLKNPAALHNAWNIAFFPLLFFFSGLFYTDVLSTAVVLKMYYDFLNQRSGMCLYLTGIVALTMRQTNIFWAAAFLGGLEVVRTLKAIEVGPQGKEPESIKGIARAAFYRYQKGKIHDIPLNNADISDFALCALSIGIATIFHPLLISQKIWPYIGILLSFAYFVHWNGGVVLGDKENHVATIHLSQLLYLWPLIAFFSFPLLLPTILKPLFSLLSIRSFTTPQISTKRALPTLTTVLALAVLTTAIIHFNTLIHPFTLADNRHYMFYIFRYSILRHPLIRYILAPIYILSAHLVYCALSASTASIQPPPIAKSPGAKKIMAEIQRNRKIHSVKTGQLPTTSFFIIWIVATALSLVTAPLVEPRYFILPWVMFRLNVPSFTLPTPSTGNKPKVKATWLSENLQLPGNLLELKQGIKLWGWEGHDPRLWVETIWFMAINAVTMHVFLYKGFEWPQEPGKVQRFMW